MRVSDEHPAVKEVERLRAAVHELEEMVNDGEYALAAMRAELLATRPTLAWLRNQFGDEHYLDDDCTAVWGNGIAWFGESAYKQDGSNNLFHLGTRAAVLAAVK